MTTASPKTYTVSFYSLYSLTSCKRLTNAIRPMRDHRPVALKYSPNGFANSIVNHRATFLSKKHINLRIFYPI